MTSKPRLQISFHTESKVSSLEPTRKDDKININEFELEKLSLENFNEILDNCNNNIYLKDFEVENKKNNYDIFEKQDKIIDHLENVEFTSCVVIDFVKGKIQRCGEIMKLRQLKNLFGNHEIKKDILTKTFDTLLTFRKVTSNHNITTATNTATNTSSDDEKIFLNEPPSLFMIKFLFKKTPKKEEKKSINDFEQFGCEFRQKIWNS
ncbi:hypothetical protein C1645_835092 [Glomus cerebriforme]|uniref:Uncharacterized protein n=1 Tax=Glomus cerebriforme TaxID=658196 RepID=A0A397SJB1_9GLOM|nr:hypothetical protein C1645_835092 [Glomus cerebriforme]